jgi:hypothetical protein
MRTKKGMEVLNADGNRVLLPFDKVVKMERAEGVLWIKLFDPMGVSLKIKDGTEVDKVWCEFQIWLTGPVGTPLSM